MRDGKRHITHGGEDAVDDTPDKEGRVIVDRIIEGFAVLEVTNDFFSEWPLSELPDGLRDGDRVRVAFTIEGRG